MTKEFKIIVERHPDGYVAYPLGIKGAIVGQGDTYEDALADLESAIAFHIETFGEETLEIESPICTQSGISREEFMDAYDRT